MELLPGGTQDGETEGNGSSQGSKTVWWDGVEKVRPVGDVEFTHDFADLNREFFFFNKGINI